MEVVAQWLDDLEDVIFVLPHAWERLRAWCLHLGFLSAVMLQAQQISRVLTEWSVAFALAAGISVCIWAVGLVATEIAWRRHGLVRARLTP